MKLVIEVLSRSLANLQAEENNILNTIDEINGELAERKQDLNVLRSKMQELTLAISILGAKDVTTTSKDKKIKSKSSNP